MVLDKRRSRVEMVALTIAILVSHDTTTKGGGLSWFTFSISALPFEIWSQTWVASMHWDRNKYVCFNNLIEMIVEIHEIAQFTRATPGRSVVSIYLNGLERKLALIFQHLIKKCTWVINQVHPTNGFLLMFQFLYPLRANFFLTFRKAGLHKKNYAMSQNCPIL